MSKQPAEDPVAALNFTLGTRIAKRVAAGDDIKTAVDTVLGAGTYDAIAGDLYDALQASAGVSS